MSTDSAELQRLTDVEAIKQLKARYFRLLDTKQWQEWGLVFSEDIHFDIPEGNFVTDGRDNVVKYTASAAGDITSHHGHMPEIEITGPDTATGVWAMFDYVEWKVDGGESTVGFQGFGHYHEEYAREDGVWYIKKLSLSRLRVDPLPGGFPDVFLFQDRGPATDS